MYTVTQQYMFTDVKTMELNLFLYHNVSYNMFKVIKASSMALNFNNSLVDHDHLKIVKF